MTKRLVRKPRIDMDEVMILVREWANTSAMIDKLSKRKDNDKPDEPPGLKQQLIEAVVRGGYEHDGHLWLDLPEPVDGIVQLKWERRQPRPVLNEERALAFLARKKLLDEVAPEVTVRELDEDKLVAVAFDKRITEVELNRLYDVPDPTYAFRPLK